MIFPYLLMVPGLFFSQSYAVVPSGKARVCLILLKRRSGSWKRLCGRLQKVAAIRVVCDQSPCLHRMKQHITGGVNLYESAEFVWKFLKDRLEFTQSVDPIALHLTCSTKLMKIDGYVRDLAALCSWSVLVPEGVGCCGFAGDKGMTHPELNRYALRKLAGQIRENCVETGYPTAVPAK